VESPKPDQFFKKMKKLNISIEESVFYRLLLKMVTQFNRLDRVPAESIYLEVFDFMLREGIKVDPDLIAMVMNFGEQKESFVEKLKNLS
jgi:hypothetical protein